MRCSATAPTSQIARHHLIAVCMIGQGERCCRYVIADILPSPSPASCAKHDQALAAELDRRAAAGRMIARGDNCPGFRAQ